MDGLVGARGRKADESKGEATAGTVGRFTASHETRRSYISRGDKSSGKSIPKVEAKGERKNVYSRLKQRDGDQASAMLNDSQEDIFN